MAENTSAARLAPAPERDVPQPTLRHYAAVTALLSCFGVALHFVLVHAPRAAPAPGALLGPVFALAALVAVVWLLMVGFRNYAILRDISRAAYYADYRQFAPPDWVERPARVFNNLMQIPILFWCVCALMMITRTFDAGQLRLAWVFVAMRVVHALIYMIWNYIPARFASWNAGTITLGVIWVRFAVQSWALVMSPAAS